MNLTYTRSGSPSSRLSICPLGTNPALVIRAWDAVLEALVDANSFFATRLAAGLHFRAVLLFKK